LFAPFPLLQIIGQMLVVDLGYLFGVKPVLPVTQDYEIWRQETRNITLSYGVKCISLSWTV